MRPRDIFPTTALLTAALLAAPGIATTPVEAADFTLKYGVVTQGDMQHLYGLKLKEAIEKATNGRIEVKVFPGGQLGAPAAHIEGLQLGTIEGYSNPADFFAGVDSRFGTFSIPYLFKDRDHANRTLQDPELSALILGMVESKGIVGVNIAAQAESHYFARNPIRKLADFSGKKLRVNATAAERARMQAFGATAVPMGLAEMITSLQSGVIDGTMSGISIYVNFNLQTVSKTITETNDTLLVSFGAHEQAVARQAAGRSAQDRRRRGARAAGLGNQAVRRREGRAAGEVDRARRRDHHAAGRRHGRAAEAPETDRRGGHQVRSQPQGFLREGAGHGCEILTARPHAGARAYPGHASPIRPLSFRGPSAARQPEIHNPRLG